MNGSLENPAGVTERFAYQTFDTDLPTNAEVRATVDAISTGLDCENASFDSILTNYDWRHDTFELNFTLSSSTCHTGVPDVSVGLLSGSEINITHPTGKGYIGLTTPRNCNSPSSESFRDLDIVVMLFGLLQLSPQIGNNISTPGGYEVPNATMLRSTQLICRPTYSMVRVDITRNSSRAESFVSPNPQMLGPLDNISAWDIFNAYWTSSNSYGNEKPAAAEALTDLTVCGESITVNQPFRTALSDSSKVQCPVDFLLQRENLVDFMTAHYQRYAAVLVHHLIMEPISAPSNGSAVIIEDRLLVQTFAAQLMAGLFAVAVFLSAIALILIPQSPMLKLSPNTLLAQGILASQNHDICQALENMGYVIQEPLNVTNGNIHHATLTAQYSPSWPTKQASQNLEMQPTKAQGHVGVSPLAVRKEVRVIACLLVFIIISTLETTLHLSNRNTGLGNVISDTYLHYLWTGIPSVVMSLLSLYFGAVDFDLRALTGYHLLSTGAPFDHTVNLNLLDKSAPRIALNQWGIRAYFGLASTIAMMTASLFTIFTSSLFVAQSIPKSSSSHLLTSDSFRESDPGITSNEDGYTSALLVLEANLSYPAFTYQNLVIPRLTLSPESKMGSEGQDKESYTPTLVYTVNVPAFRTNLTCDLYDSSRFVVANNYEKDSNGKNKPNPFNAFVSIQGVHPDNFLLLDYNQQSIGGFGSVREYSTSSWQYLYAWGSFDTKLPTNFTFAAGMTCNDTIEVVDIEATFMGTNLDIDTTKPPVPIESTARKLLQNNVDHDSYETNPPSQDLYYKNIYEYLPSFSSSRSSPLTMDSFFNLVTSSRYAQPQSALGDLAKREDMVRSIKLHHSIITASLLAHSRDSFNNTNATIHQRDNGVHVYNATATDPNGVISVVQQGTATRILKSLLAVTLVLSITSWALMPNTASMSSEELKSHYFGVGFDQFRIGWGITTSNKEGQPRERFLAYVVSFKDL
ncbi:hypothetical protein F4777DRAFT_276142 [Nemania sp. FL0916]|nr:hypothetical protein F4777DRAFT_276142 [Nemania sp. FL0916]